MQEKNLLKNCAVKIVKIALLIFVLYFISVFSIRAVKIAKCESAAPLSETEKASLDSFLRNNYSSQYQILKPLPYKTLPAELEVFAESAIVIDAANGNILYEKNPDEVIPPASMTKLFSMFVADEEISSGRFQNDTIIPLPPESWACNMMPHSSLMFLGQGQIVTMEELLQGLSVCSGNDAAYALAYTISGNMENFIQRMNQTAINYNLTNTRFVESSGYSELNTTTAREMAAFSKVYLELHPDSLKRYHSLQSFTYPKEKNLAPGDTLSVQDFSNGFPSHITMSITQRNTNPLLGILDGCDGLKTGYIDESGYNLSLTCLRHDTRFISVTMKGPGNSAREGNEYRKKDGTTLMEWAFNSFCDYKDMTRVKPYLLRACGGRTIGLNLVPAYKPEALTVPFISGNSAEESAQNVKVITKIPSHINSGIQQGEKAGSVDFMLEGHLLESVPLVADRTIKKADPIVRLCDRIVYKIIELR